MKPLHHRDEIVRAVFTLNWLRLDQLATQLADAERAREMLQAKGYGSSGMSASAVAAQVPEAKR